MFDVLRNLYGKLLATWLALACGLAFGVPAEASAPAHGRAWELVTTGPGHGVPLIESRAWSPDGNRIVFPSLGPMPGAPSGELFSHSLGVRGPSGWKVEGVGQQFDAGTTQILGTSPLAVDRDLEAWVWGSIYPLLPGAPADPLMGVYYRAPDGSLTLLGDVGQWQQGFPAFATSADLQHVAFETQQQLAPEDSGRIGGRAAYELAGQELRFVGLDETGSPPSACGSVFGNGSYDIGNGSFDPALSSHAISDDGSRIFFTSPDPNSGACSDRHRVYLREAGVTTKISTSQCTRPDCNALADVRFLGARPDGSRALLVGEQQLTDDDTDLGADLYRYDVASGDLTRLSVGPAGVVADVDIFVARASDDLDRVYFIAGGELVPGEGQAGGRNLYVYDHGEIRFVGAVDAGGLGGIRFASTTDDGNVLLFATSAQLLPGDTDANADVYRYEADDDTLVQVSTGGAGLGNGAQDALLPVFTVEMLPGQVLRSLTADGERAFFLTPEALVPEDANDGLDVYEWTDGGGVGLITPGVGDGRLAYSGASADGRSVFFLTDESLLPSDRDGGDRDLYVARLGGGFPEPSAPPACDGDACQGTPLARRDRPAPATSTFSGEQAQDGLRLRRLGTAARRRLVRTGQAALEVVVPSRGRVSLVARARIGGRLRIVARDAATAAGPGRVRLTLRLSGAARRTLKPRGGALRVRLAVRHPGADEAHTAVLMLRSAR